MKFKYSKIIEQRNDYPNTGIIVSVDVYNVIDGKISKKDCYRADSIQLEKYNFVCKLWELIDNKKISQKEAEELYNLSEDIFSRGYSEGTYTDFD